MLGSDVIHQGIHVGDGVGEAVDEAAWAFRPAMTAMVDGVDGTTATDQCFRNVAIAPAVLANTMCDQHHGSRRSPLRQPGLVIDLEPALTRESAFLMPHDLRSP